MVRADVRRVAATPCVTPPSLFAQSRQEFVNLAGLRMDGRRPGEVRRIRARFGVATQADGSAYFEQGGTKVLAAVYGPREPHKRAETLHDRAVVRCECTMAPYASTEHKRRRGGDRKTTEIALAVRNTFSGVIQTHLFARSEIYIVLLILQSDGGDLAACLNAASLAVADAGVPMSDLPVGCTAGFVDNHVLLDLNYVESGVGVDICVGLLPNSKEGIPLMQMEAKATIEVFEELLKQVRSGCEQIHDTLTNLLKERTAAQSHSQSVMIVSPSSA